MNATERTRYGLYDLSRGLTLALAAGLAGLGLWGAAQLGTQTPGGFWVATVVVAAAGLLFSLVQHVGTWTKGLRLRFSPGMLVLGFLPVLVCVGWILLVAQPGNGWEEGRLNGWSASLGILGAVHAIGLWSGVVAFGFGLVLGLSLDAVPAPAAESLSAAAPAADADEPLTAERPRGASSERRTLPKRTATRS